MNSSCSPSCGFSEYETVRNWIARAKRASADARSIASGAAAAAASCIEVTLSVRATRIATRRRRSAPRTRNTRFIGAHRSARLLQLSRQLCARVIRRVVDDRADHVRLSAVREDDDRVAGIW